MVFWLHLGVFRLKDVLSIVKQEIVVTGVVKSGKILPNLSI